MLRWSSASRFHHNPNSPQGHSYRFKEAYRNHHEAHGALGSDLYSPVSVTVSSNSGSNTESNFSSSYTAATTGRVQAQHPNKAAARPAPPHKLPMLMNVAKACPPGYGGTALSPSKKFDGLRIVAAAFRAHEKVIMKKMMKDNKSSLQQEEFDVGTRTNYLYYDDQCLVVPDMYPKSTFHFLVLPRVAASSSAGSKPPMSIAEVKQEPGHVNLVRRMDSVCAEMVKTLFAAPEINVSDPRQLERILRIGREAEGARVADDDDDVDESMMEDSSSSSFSIADYDGVPQTMLRQWLMKTRSEARMKQYLAQVEESRQEQQQQQQQQENPTAAAPPMTPPPPPPPPQITKLKFMSGFHSLPSLCPLHMHIASLDLVSDCLKNKKHYNSFTTGFFLSRAFVEDQLIKYRYVKRAVDPRSVEECERLENQELRCVWCQMPLRSMPDLKQHLIKCSNNACYF